MTTGMMFAFAIASFLAIGLFSLKGGWLALFSLGLFGVALACASFLLLGVP